MKEGNKNNAVIKQGIIPEFISGSSTYAVDERQQPQQAWKTLKPVQGLSCFMSSGFTLIELLVVVLIIGILAAVALPQYRFAVDKTRLMNYISLGEGIRRAQEIYYLEHLEYPSSLEALDIDYMGNCTSINPNSTNNQWSCPDGFFLDNVSQNGKAKGMLKVYFCPGYNNSYNCTAHYITYCVFYYDQYSEYPSYAGKAYCVGKSTDTYGQKLARSVNEII